MRPQRVKILSPWFNPCTEKRLLPHDGFRGLSFTANAEERDYDWLVVYDEFARNHVVEQLACPPEQTILVTQEPPNIKLYHPFYTHQFGYVLTTHDAELFSHPNWRRGQGCFIWLDGWDFDQHATAAPPEKTLGLSAVHSGKQMKHTDHNKRYRLLVSIRDNIENFDWYGFGVRELKNKYDALHPYRYHVVIENYNHPYHWSEKIADALIHYCLPFYAGDSALEEVLPADSFIRIPLDDHAEAVRIIQEAMSTNQYERRLPAIIEARQRLLSDYNLFAQLHNIISAHQQEPAAWKPNKSVIKRRHLLRKNPLNALQAFYYQLRYKLR